MTCEGGREEGGRSTKTETYLLSISKSSVVVLLSSVGSTSVREENVVLGIELDGLEGKEEKEEERTLADSSLSFHHLLVETLRRESPCGIQMC